MPVTTWAPNAQKTTQRGGEPRGRPERVPAERAASRVSQSTASVGMTSAATTITAAPATVSRRARPPNILRTVSTPRREEAPVVDRVERAVEGDVEADVEELHQHEHAERRTEHACDDAPHTVRQHDGEHDDDDSLERKSHECAGREQPRLGWRHQRDPHDGGREHRERDSSERLSLARTGGTAFPPQPPDVPAERLGEQGERDDEDGTRGE